MRRTWWAAALVVGTARLGLADGLPPEVLLRVDPAGGPVNVKVRRIGEVKPISTVAPPPANALKGRRRIVVALIDSDETPWPKTADPKRIEEMLFAKDAISMREYYRENSYGAFTVEGKVVGPIRIAETLEEYVYQPGKPNEKMHKLVDMIVRQLDHEVDLRGFDEVDTRGRPGADGVVDHVMIVYAEKTGDPLGFSPIWPHRGTTDVDTGKIRVVSYTILNHGAPLGVYAHEFGHDIGLPDLYDRDNTSHGDGLWCLMAAGSWAAHGHKPSHLSAWAKAQLGWLVPTIVDESTPGLAVPSSSERPFALRLPIGTVDSPEYFLLENRRKVGFDSDLPAEGLVVWHVDENRGDNDDEKRKLLDVVEAQGVQDLDALEPGRFPDYSGDVFSSRGKDTFDDDSTPSARLYSGEPSNLRVKVLSDPGRTMTIDVTRPKIFNPGGIPFVLQRDGWQFGRFSTVPTGPGSEALVKLEATPGGYLVFGAEAFMAGQAKNERGAAVFRIYADDKGQPGKKLAESRVEYRTQADGYSWIKTRFTEDERGIRFPAGRLFWLGVTSEEGKMYPALNPMSTSKLSGFRRGPTAKLETTFHFREGPAPVNDYILRIHGFGYLEGFERPEPLANDADPRVVRMKAIDKQADDGRFAEALPAYEALLAEMEKEPRRYESWIPVVTNSIGVAAYELKRYAVARERFQSSLRRAQAAKERATEADIFQNLCETAFHARDHEEARVECDRSRRLNLSLGRPDRLVENFYWLGRAFSEGPRQDRALAQKHYEAAAEAAEAAFAKDRAQLDEWRGRLAKAKAGKPEDEDRVAERVEPEKKGGGTHKAIYTDLLQFLDEDTKDSTE